MNKMKKLVLVVVALSCVPGRCVPGADTSHPAPTPVLVELFTSEGCSSCPPADALLQQMDRSQPIAGAQIIVLSEHVDYWDHIGWKDPYSSRLLTERQGSYAAALGGDTVYTPQLIVDGRGELHVGGSTEVLQKAAAGAKIPVQIGSATLQASPAPAIRAHVEADGASSRHDAEIFAVCALDHAESQVLRGENSGRHLQHVAVVQSLVKVGRLEKGKTFSRDVDLPLKPGTNPANLRLIVFVQEAGPGRILGAALRKIGN